MPPKDKKEKPAGWNLTATEWLIVMIFVLALVSSIGPSLIRYFTSSELSFYGYKLGPLIDFFIENTLFFKALGFTLAGGAAIGTFVYNKMADEIWAAQKANLYPQDMPASFDSKAAQVQSEKSTKWQEIVKLSQSDNPSDWRLSIIEADIMLDELLEKLHLPGDTMGDKLRSVEKSDFVTIDYAWEAHKARNMIAHEGSNFLINQREVIRIISLYEAVFKEFYLI